MTRANGLRLFTSNRLENLAEQLAGVVEEPLDSPFAAETVLVQSQGMARWLQMELARRQGVCANVRFPFPKAFSDEVAQRVLAEVPGDSLFQLDALAWRVMGLLPKLRDQSAFSDLKNYLGEEIDQRRRWQLAERIAYVFDQYLIFRPDLIAKWDAGQENDWQAILWRELAGKAKHPAKLHSAVIDKLKSNSAKIRGLPERLALFGISVLPPFYLELFAALSRHLPVNIFLLQPTPEFWGDVVSSQRAGKVLKQLKLAPGAEAGAHLETGNRLLASLGQQGQDFFNLIQEAERVEPVENFSEPDGDTLLATIQSDIFNLRDRGRTEDAPAKPLATGDDSLQVHSCHSPLRELEVLHDHLLDWFNRDPQLAPRDVLVMMPDLKTYAPLVQAVFGSPETEARRIPFSVADRGARHESHVVETFLKLLNLPATRLGVVSVLEILQTDAVRAKFRLEEQDLERIHEWVERAGIRWGIDADHRAEWNVPALAGNTWRAGLDRLLLGYAMGGRGEKLFHGLLPMEDVEGSVVAVLGRFVDFAERIFRMVKNLGTPRTIVEWEVTLRTLLEEFFHSNEDSEQEFQLLRQAIGKLRHAATLAKFDEPVALSVILEPLTKLLEEDSFGAGFLTGGVTFCALKPMRSLPFKVICLVGMSDNAFPRQTASLGFDKMNDEHRAGDRSSRNDDRYLFLETLLSARQRLYISYVGQSIRDNSKAPPSVLVSELLDYVEQGFVISGGSNPRSAVETFHRLQAFSPAYFSGERLFSYSAENCAAARAVIGEPGEPAPFVTEPLSEPEPAEEWRTVTIETLVRFFAQPAEFFLKRRLRLTIERDEAALEEREAMELNQLDQYNLRQSLLEHKLSNRDPALAHALIQADGRLPLGVVGAARLRDSDAEVERFHERLKPLLAAAAPTPVDIDLAIGKFRLTGRLTRFGRAGLLHYRCADLKPKDWLQVWIEHLALCAVRPANLVGRTVLIGNDETGTLRPVENAVQVLRELLDQYWAGLRSPLKFFPKSSWKFVENKTSTRSRTPPRDAARGVWTGGEFADGERDGAGVQLCFRNQDPIDDEFERVTLAVLGPLFAHLEKEAL